MGLDNGIIVRSGARRITRETLPQGIQYPFGEDFNGDPEIIYWRKNWGLRSAVIRVLKPEEVNLEARKFPYSYFAETPADVLNLIEVIAYFLNEGVWETEGQSIWSYEEVRPRLIQDIVNLALMAGFMEQNPDIYLEFYDSY